MSDQICKCGHPLSWHADEEDELFKTDPEQYGGFLNGMCVARSCRCIRFVEAEEFK